MTLFLKSVMVFELGRSAERCIVLVRILPVHPTARCVYTTKGRQCTIHHTLLLAADRNHLLGHCLVTLDDVCEESNFRCVRCIHTQ